MDFDTTVNQISSWHSSMEVDDDASMNGCESPALSLCMGVDFGTTECRVVVYPVVDDPDNMICRAWPSFIVWDAETKEWTIGNAARKQWTERSGDGHVVYDLLGLLGQKLETIETQDDNNLHALWTFTVINGRFGKAIVEFQFDANGQYVSISPEELVGAFLSKVRHEMQQLLHQPIDSVVLSVPSAFNRTQRQALRDACSIAGLEVQAMVVSATLAAFSYHQTLGCGQTLLVLDLGARTTKFSLVTKLGRLWQVKAVSGTVGAAGGLVWTKRLAEFFLKQQNDSIQTTMGIYHRVLRASEMAKWILSTSATASIDVPWSDQPSEPGSLIGSITRSEFDDMCAQDVTMLAEITTRLLRFADNVIGIPVDQVILTGGSSQIPLVQEKIASVLPQRSMLVLPGHDDGRLNDCIRKSMACAHGAAWYGLQLARSDHHGPHDRITRVRPMLFHDVLPQSLGLQSAKGDIIELMAQNVPLPAEHTMLYYASCESEVVFHVVEAEHPLTKARKPMHVLGQVRYHAARGSSSLVLKLEITVKVDAHGAMMMALRGHFVSATSLQLRITGDETCLSTEAIAAARARVFQNELPPPRCTNREDDDQEEDQAQCLVPYTRWQCATDTYMNTIEAMVQSGYLLVQLTDQTKRKLTALLQQYRVCMDPDAVIDLHMLQKQHEQAHLMQRMHQVERIRVEILGLLTQQCLASLHSTFI